MTRNEAEHVATAIECVRRALGPVDPDAEILVVDSQSTDGTTRIARRLGTRVIELSGRPGCCAGAPCRRSADASRYVLFLDGDSEVDAKFVREVWMTGSATGFLLFVFRGRSLTKPIRMLFDWAVCGPPLFYGFILGAAAPDALRIDEAVRWDSKANLEPPEAAAGRH